MTGAHSTRTLGVAAAHAGAALLHGVPHAAVPVPLAVWQVSFVTVVAVLPLAGVWLARQGRTRSGGWALLTGGLGSFGFGTHFHFLSATPDNVSAVTGGWSVPFLVTSVGVSLLAAATAAAGGRLLVADRLSG